MKDLLLFLHLRLLFLLSFPKGICFSVNRAPGQTTGPCIVGPESSNSESSTPESVNPESTNYDSLILTASKEYPIAPMDRLLEGHKRFRDEVFPEKRDHFHLLSEGQSPEWLFITCSDSRIVPDLILQTEPGDLFITRNAGNVVPVTGNEVDGVTATIEYAVEVLKVKHAILCGHSDCGALKAALNRVGLENLPKASRWLKNVEGAFRHRQPIRPEEGEHAELASIIRGNVVAQLANLRSQPSVARAIAHHRLTIHGWYYDILTGTIETYNEQEGKFYPLLGSVD